MDIEKLRLTLAGMEQAYRKSAEAYRTSTELHKRLLVKADNMKMVILMLDDPQMLERCYGMYVTDMLGYDPMVGGESNV